MSSNPAALAGASGIAAVIGISAFLAYDQLSAPQGPDSAAPHLSSPLAAQDDASASRRQAGPGSLAFYEAGDDAASKPAAAKTQASPQSQPEATKEQKSDIRLGPSAETETPSDMEPPPDMGSLSQRAMPSDEVWQGAQLSARQARRTAPLAEVNGGPIERTGTGDKPHGQGEIRKLTASSRRSAGGTSSSGRRYGSEDQTQHSAAADGIRSGRSAEAASLRAKSGSEGAEKLGSANANKTTGAGAGGPVGGAAGAEYSYGPHELQTLDFYPGAEPHAPVVVFFHGGGFTGGDKSEASNYISIRERGYAVASCNYRLIKNPSQVAGIALAAYDARNAVRWLKDNAAKLDIDRKRIVAVGVSAGGYLAAMLGSAGRDRLGNDGAVSRTSPNVQAVIDLAGPTDFGGMVIAPMQFVSRGDPPTFIRHGRSDPIVSYQHSVKYGAALQKAKVRVDIKIVDGVGHKISGSFRKQLIDESMDFVDSVLP